MAHAVRAAVGEQLCRTPLFEGSEVLFAGLDVHRHWDWSVRRPVVRLDLSGSVRTPDKLEENLLGQFADITAETGVATHAGTAAVGLRRLIRSLRRHTGERVVVLIDEYDKPILDALATPDIARANRDFLHGVYSILKACDADLEFMLLTGVSAVALDNTLTTAAICSPTAT